MKEIHIDEIKKIQLDILSKIHEYCINNKIQYFLAYGTLIGAIRHKGYIPWDDDIDIAMTRPNYDKFIQSFNGYYKNLDVLAPELDWKYYAPYANVCDNRTILHEGQNQHNGQKIGIKIDVFPIDGVPTNKQEYYKIFNTVNKYNWLLRFKRFPLKYFIKGNLIQKIKKTLVWVFMHFISYECIQKKIHKISTKIPYSNAEYATQVTFTYDRISFDKKIFEEYIDVDFEGKTFRSIKQFDKYLKAIYGNYMELPPLEERIDHHDFKAYWIE